jgi:hemolysin activation/secretion protein
MPKRTIKDSDRGCIRFSRFAAALFALAMCMVGAGASAVTLPGSADAGRVDIDRKEAVPEPPANQGAPKVLLPGSAVPTGAEQVRFTLRKVEVEGVTAFPASEINSLYQEYLGKEITLDTIWKIADAITRRYQDAGYFLSRAFVPRQDINGGVVRIRVGEGYIGEVEIKDPIAENSIIKSLIRDLKQERPARSQTVEGILLRLNDLPGVSFRSVIQPVQDENESEGAVKLLLVREEKKGTGSVSFDNYNSRYLGPYEGAASYETSLIPLQDTTVSALDGVPPQKLQYYSASHTVPLTADLSLQVTGGYTKANPGFTLSPKDIDSDAANLGVSIKDQFIRQRLENLAGTLTVDGKNNYSDVLEAPLTRDRVRAARAGLAYDGTDPLNGYSFVNVTLSHGLEVFDASTAGQKFLSREGAKPDFTKLEYSFTRYQNLAEAWTVVTALSGQAASGVLYSSEQFGYGGQAFGRAYDPSEMVGDNGIAASVELRYLGIPALHGVTFGPYSYYDVGKVWNADQGSQSGSSAGGGLRIDFGYGASANLLVAEPLTRAIEDPSSGNGKSPRYLLQMSAKF